MENISLYDLLQSRLHYINSFKLYRKTYKNYFKVIWELKHGNYPIKGILRNGEKIILRNYLETVSKTRNIDWSYDFNNDGSYTIKMNNGEVVKFYHLEEQPSDVFLNEAYPFLPVNGKTVIDIGGYIGDTAIYFIMKGAKKVIALEPFLQTFQLAKKNIKINDLEDKIDFILAGCSNKNDIIKVDPNPANPTGAKLAESKNGIDVQTLTLDKVIERSNNEASILKMNCEGDEYNIILSSSKETLRKFTHMVIEYHYGYKNLVKKLRESGFRLSHTRPIYYWNKEIKKPMYHGQIFATLI